MPKPTTSQRQDARPCGSPRCHHCTILEGPAAGRARPLTPADLAWQFGDAEALMGARSTHGALVDMAMSGPPSGGGGRANGVEIAAVQDHRLDAVARHRCIRTRLAPVPPADLEVLRAAFGPEDWSRAIGDVDLRLHVERALRGVDPAVARVLPLTAAARAHAARRQVPVVMSGTPVIVQGPLRVVAVLGRCASAQDREQGVRCAYRPSPPAPKKKARPSDHGAAPARPLTDAETLTAKLRRHLAEQPGLAGSARGHVLSACCAADKSNLRVLLAEATDILARARTAAGVQDPPRSRRVRAAHNLGEHPRAAAPLPEPATLTFASEVS